MHLVRPMRLLLSAVFMLVKHKNMLIYMHTGMKEIVVSNFTVNWSSPSIVTQFTMDFYCILCCYSLFLPLASQKFDKWWRNMKINMYTLPLFTQFFSLFIRAYYMVNVHGLIYGNFSKTEDDFFRLVMRLWWCKIVAFKKFVLFKI